MKYTFILKNEFDRVAKCDWESDKKLELLALMCRLNALSAVKKAGSGHLGSSFSAMDIVVYLYHSHLNIKQRGVEDQNRDVYFSSKGHDVPGFYAVLYSLGIIPLEKLLMLRKLGGLDGHPDRNIPGVEANSGSLGMGISKARGMAYAKHYNGHTGRVFVLTGDGEFQEGQNFEALQVTAGQKMNNMLVIMDHNKLQSDRMVERIIGLGDLEKKITSFGWHVARCDGHDFSELSRTLIELEAVQDKPKFLICDTVKGKGISFMEHPQALRDGNGFYKWHAGAPADDFYLQAVGELKQRAAELFGSCGIPGPQYHEVESEKTSSVVSSEYVAAAYGEALVEIGKSNKKFVVLDADLSADCKIIGFEKEYPRRFIECGIAEQDMVSMAGGMALWGLVPVVNSFASFLASRPNEQIYNNLTEKTKIIYACHYAGLIPAGPGKSHQSLRDISLFQAFPDCTVLQAANAVEMKMITEYALNHSPESCMLRINIGPSPRVISLPEGYVLKKGRGARLTEGKKLVLMSYGPVMLNEALTASELLAAKGVKLKVINMPWLNRFDLGWLEEELYGAKSIFILEDHFYQGGLGSHLLFAVNNTSLKSRKYYIWGIEDYPACGMPPEVLAHHGLDGRSLAARIRNMGV